MVSLNKYIIRIALLLYPVFVSGQAGNIDSIQSTTRKAGIYEQETAARQKEYLTGMYFKTFATSNDFINGKEYFNYAYKSRNTPLLFSAKNFTAVLFMDGKEYNNIRLQYDSYLDEIIYIDTSRSINYQFPKVILKKDAVDGFILIDGPDSMKFRNFKFLNDSKKNSDSGYYEEVYTGPSRYLIKHRAILYLKEARNEYAYSPENFILKDGVFHKIKNNKEFINLFGNKSKEIGTFLRKNRINVRKASKKDIAETLKYCDELAKKQ